MTAPASRLIIALDFDHLKPAYEMAQRLAGCAAMFKIGSQLFTAEGPRAVERISHLGAGIFLDLKFHDIPSTVAGSVAAASVFPAVGLVSVHALGGLGMMRAANRAVRKGTGRNRPKLLAVTILTSLDAAALRQVGVVGRPHQRAVKLAQLAHRAGLDGVVASAHEARAIRRACGEGFLIVVPGVRPAALGAAARADDQARVATPAEAIRAGADFVVVGRPITAARDPRAAVQAILEDISQALCSRI